MDLLGRFCHVTIDIIILSIGFWIALFTCVLTYTAIVVDIVVKLNNYYFNMRKAVPTGSLLFLNHDRFSFAKNTSCAHGDTICPCLLYARCCGLAAAHPLHLRSPACLASNSCGCHEY